MSDEISAANFGLQAPRTLLRVHPLAIDLGLGPGGSRVTLISLEMWDYATVLNYAMTPSTFGTGGYETWSCTDQDGTRYPPLTPAASGGGNQQFSRHWMEFTPVADTASRLVVSALWSDGRPLVDSFTIDLAPPG